MCLLSFLNWGPRALEHWQWILGVHRFSMRMFNFVFSYRCKPEKNKQKLVSPSISWVICIRGLLFLFFSFLFLLFFVASTHRRNPLCMVTWFPYTGIYAHITVLTGSLSRPGQLYQLWKCGHNPSQLVNSSEPPKSQHPTPLCLEMSSKGPANHPRI